MGTVAFEFIFCKPGGIVKINCLQFVLCTKGFFFLYFGSCLIFLLFNKGSAKPEFCSQTRFSVMLFFLPVTPNNGPMLLYMTATVIVFTGCVAAFIHHGDREKCFIAVILSDDVPLFFLSLNLRNIWGA